VSVHSDQTAVGLRAERETIDGWLASGQYTVPKLKNNGFFANLHVFSR
jgi:hypothetical protein